MAAYKVFVLLRCHQNILKVWYITVRSSFKCNKGEMSTSPNSDSGCDERCNRLESVNQKSVKQKVCPSYIPHT